MSDTIQISNVDTTTGALDTASAAAVDALIASAVSGLTGATLPGLFVAMSNGLVGNGTTDDGPALQTLANITMAGSGTIYFTPGNTYRIATNTTIPKGVSLWVPSGAKFTVDGVVLTIRGPIIAGLYPIFSYVNGGSVLFTATNAEAAGKRAVAVTEVYPEWWGAKADGSNDDAPAINACITSISGLPAATSGSRWAAAMIRLSQGSYYCHSTLQIASLHGLRIEGAGYQTTRLSWKGASLASTATAGSTTTLTDSAQTWTTNQYAPGLTTWYAYIKSGTGVGQWAQIASNTATALTFASAVTTAPDSTSAYYIVPQALLDLDGAFDAQLSHLTLDGGNYVRHGLYYHWLGSVSAASSSRLKMYGVQVTGGTVDSAFQLGGFDTAEENQADMVGLFGCQALAGIADTGLYQNGFTFGSGVFSNPLNYSCYDCESVGYTNGVTVASTNVNWIGGTIQSNTNDLFFLNGVQGYSVFSGFRSENSQRLVNSQSAQQLAMNVRISDVNFVANKFANNPSTSLPDLVYSALPGNLVLDNVSAVGGQLAAVAVTSATGTTATATAWTLPTINGGVAGWNALVTVGTGSGQRRTISSNTATQITVPTWTITPDATSQIQVYPAPRIAVANTTTVLAGQLSLQGTPAESAIVQLSGTVSRGRLEAYEELDTSGIAMGTSLVNATFGGLAPELPKATMALGVVGSVPDTIMTRHKAATLGTTALESGSLRALGYGATPAPFVDKGTGTGSTSYTYFTVAKDGAGNALGLASAGTTITNQNATLAYSTAYNRVWLPLGNHIPAVAYDILRGDTSHSVALNVPWYKFPYHDDRTTTDAYTAPVTDGTGTLTVDNTATFNGPVTGLTESSVNPVAFTVDGNIASAITLTWTLAKQKRLVTATVNNGVVTVAGIPSGGSMVVQLNSGAGSLATTFAVGSGMGSLRWMGGAPTTTLVASKLDEFLFVFNGTDTIGYITGQGA